LSLRSPTLQRAGAKHKGRFAVRRIYRKLVRREGNGALRRFTVQPRVTFGYRFGQLLGYFRKDFSADVPTLTVNLVLTYPPSITTAVD
jgi:hypothetical protein